MSMSVQPSWTGAHTGVAIAQKLEKAFGFWDEKRLP